MFFSFSLMNFSFVSFASVYDTSKMIYSHGNIIYNKDTFILRGACVAYNIFNPNARNYQPKVWEILEDLGVNYINVWGGIEGDLNHINIKNFPNEWAENLDNFLTEADNHGIKVIFIEMGSRWYSLFGIISPGISPGETSVSDRPYTPIDEAKSLIDKLAGDNYLGHDFITDSRILGWKTSNERDIANEIVYEWNIELCNYIHSKGGKVWMGSPKFGSWEHEDFDTIEPLIGENVDYLERHMYEITKFYQIGS
ncbi:MAG: hypothetical protein ACFFDN_42225, partial [Candidatus Hodarchaeota archaeon]